MFVGGTWRRGWEGYKFCGSKELNSGVGFTCLKTPSFFNPKKILIFHIKLCYYLTKLPFIITNNLYLWDELDNLNACHSIYTVYKVIEKANQGTFLLFRKNWRISQTNGRIFVTCTHINLLFLIPGALSLAGSLFLCGCAPCIMIYQTGFLPDKMWLLQKPHCPEFYSCCLRVCRLFMLLLKVYKR